MKMQTIQAVCQHGTEADVFRLASLLRADHENTKEAETIRKAAAQLALIAMNTIKVIYDGNTYLMSVSDAVASHFGIHDGYLVKNEAEFLEISRAITSYNILVCMGPNNQKK